MRRSRWRPAKSRPAHRLFLASGELHEELRHPGFLRRRGVDPELEGGRAGGDGEGPRRGEGHLAGPDAGDPEALALLGRGLARESFTEVDPPVAEVLHRGEGGLRSRSRLGGTGTSGGLDLLAEVGKRS